MAHCSKVKEEESKCALNINKGDLLVIDDMISSGVSVNIKDSLGRSALHVAVDYSLLFLPRPFGYLLDVKCYSNLSLSLVKLLITYGADINIRNENEEPVLHSAIKCKNFKAGKILVNNCADVNLIDQYGHNALFNAIISNNHELVSIILRNDGKTDLIDVFGKTVLHYAVETNNVDIVNCIIDYIPNIYDFILIKSNIGESCLHLAVKNSNYKIVEVLLDLGADIDQEDHHGMTPLLKVNAYLILNHNQNNISSKDFECSSCKVTKLLLNKGAFINHLSKFNHSVLQLAIQENHVCGVKLLIQRGSSINDDRIHPPCLYTAIKNKNLEIISILLENGADIYKPNPLFHTPDLLESAILSDITFHDLKYIFKILSCWLSETTGQDFFSSKQIIEITKMFLNVEVSVKRHLRSSNEPDDDIIETLNNYFDLLYSRSDEKYMDVFIVLINYHTQENERVENQVPNFPSPQNSYSAVLNKFKLMIGHLYDLRNLLDYHIKYETLNKQIVKEIENLKKSNISRETDFTYYHLLTKDSKISSMVLYHNNFLKDNLMNDQWRDNFPVFAPFLNAKLQRIFKRNSLLAHAHLFFDLLNSKLGYPKLVPLCIDKIINLLSTGSLSSIKNSWIFP